MKVKNTFKLLTKSSTPPANNSVLSKCTIFTIIKLFECISQALPGGYYHTH